MKQVVIVLTRKTVGELLGSLRPDFSGMISVLKLILHSHQNQSQIDLIMFKINMFYTLLFRTVVKPILIK